MRYNAVDRIFYDAIIDEIDLRFMVKHIRLFVFFCFFSVLPVPAGADDLVFAPLLAAARDHAVELRIAAVEVAINKKGLSEAAAGYYPTLSLRMNNEYFHDFAGGGNTTTVGDTVISGSGSSYQNSVSMVAEYSLWDFGRQSSRYGSAVNKVRQAEFDEKAACRKLDLELLDLFHRGLRTDREIEARKKVLGIRQRIYEAGRRLRRAGKQSAIDLATAGVAVAEALSAIDELRVRMVDILTALSRYTGEDYPPDKTGFAPFNVSSGDFSTPGIEELPEIRAVDAAIAVKEEELNGAKSAWLPRLGLYYSYKLYGSDSSSFRESFDDLRRRNYAVGITWEWNLFNGFADSAKVGRLTVELEKLQLERKRRIVGLVTERMAMEEKAAVMETAGAMRKKRAEQLAEKKKLSDRLEAGKVRDLVFFLKGRERDVLDRLALDLEEIDQQAIRARLWLWNGGWR